MAGTGRAAAAKPAVLLVQLSFRGGLRRRLTALASPGRRSVRLVLTLRPDASSNACTISSTVVPAGQQLGVVHLRM